MSPTLNSMGISATSLLRFVLVLIRIGTMFSIFPIFSASQIPAQVKILFSLLITALIVGTLPPLTTPSNLVQLALDVCSQMFLGFVLGSVGVMIFGGIQFAGELIDTQVGFAITNIINPMTNTSVTVLGQFELIIATLIFLGTDSHHLLLEGIAGSFRLVPLPTIAVSPGLINDVLSIFTESIDLVFKIAIPIAVSLLITNVAMGLLARVAPQVNVFIVAFPAQLGIGMIMFLLSLPLLGYVLPVIFGKIPLVMDHMLRHMSPRIVR